MVEQPQVEVLLLEEVVEELYCQLLLGLPQAVGGLYCQLLLEVEEVLRMATMTMNSNRLS